MEVGSATSTAATSNSTASTTANRASVDYDAFLKLLVAEMANQDPTNPMKSSEYIAQLASFSGVEQSIQTNAKLDKLLSMSAIARADDMIGRTVTSADGSVSGEVKSIIITADGATAVLADGQKVALTAGITIQ